jgi:hypothetical protein
METEMKNKKEHSNPMKYSDRVLPSREEKK